MADEIQPLKFFTDNHISLEAINELRRQGVNVIRAFDVGFPQNEPDIPLLEHTTENGLIMVTCDHNFLQHDKTWKLEDKEHGGIIYFDMAGGDCKRPGKIVRVLLKFHQEVLDGEATYQENFYNQVKYTYQL